MNEIECLNCPVFDYKISKDVLAKLPPYATIYEFHRKRVETLEREVPNIKLGCLVFCGEKAKEV